MPTTYVSRISQWIEKRFNAKGGNVITDIDPTAVVMTQFESGVEDLYLKGWNRYIGSFAVTAVAAQFSRAMLRNPPSSNVIAVVESVWLNNANIDYAITNNQPNLANVQLPGTFLRRIDSRQGFSDSTCVLSNDNNATGFPGTAAVVMRTAAATRELFVNPNSQWTILPNDAMFFISDVVNTAIQLNLQWRERALEQSELT